MGVEENKAILRAFVEALNQGDTKEKGAWRKAEAFLAPNYEEHRVISGMPQGLEGWRMFETVFFGGFPDMYHTLYDMAGEGNKIGVRYKWEGTHTGTWFGVQPTGRRVTVHGQSIFYFENGKIKEDWGDADALGLMGQVGMLG